LFVWINRFHLRQQIEKRKRKGRGTDWQQNIPQTRVSKCLAKVRKHWSLGQHCFHLNYFAESQQGAKIEKSVWIGNTQSAKKREVIENHR
jgi:type II secretory pathway component PulK